MASVPYEAVVEFLYVLPERLTEVDIIVNRSEHLLYSALGESVQIACIEEVYALIGLNILRQIVVAVLVGRRVKLDLTAIALLEHSKLCGHVFACAVGIDIPVGQPFDLFIFQFSRKEIVILGIIVDLLSHRGIEILFRYAG